MLARRKALASIVVLLVLLAAASLASARSASENGRSQPPALPGAQAISAQDRVYTSDQTSNTITVINPATNEVLGTIALGESRLDGVLGPVDTNQVNVHGLGFSPDGRFLTAISVSSNAAQVIETATNEVVMTTYVGRAPHEGMIAPDGQTLWVAVRGQNYVAVIDLASGQEIDRIETAAGASKVVFSPNGQLAWVNHLFTNELVVIDVATRQVVRRIPIPAEAGGSADLAIAPDNKEVWLGHPNNGKTTVVDAQRFRVKAVLDTGPRTNHPNFISRGGQDFAYVTIGGLNQTLVFKRTGGTPQLVTTIQHNGVSPHGIWPSPDNTRLYVALQKSDALDVIDTATNTIIATLHVGQSPQAVVYVANAVPQGGGLMNLTQQGLGRRVENLTVEVQGTTGSGNATIREVAGLDEIDVTARGLPPNQAFTVYAKIGENQFALMEVQSNAAGVVPEALTFTKFFDNNYEEVCLIPIAP